ncbi:hypothetical protein CANARDRAFT_176304 [[Candida] arabinofermentans NRRL YB-2248]|uniref:Cupin type-2 domain-containing protein n=1 Tax=[Candida] arabinofermentans NRRL YB-2248 TaxID=983967 RepID=A0A1E4SZG5_9ASCO|nr:hypothetical protein CANARDRAFT_176304 [[Candida] arabinofermentans NRRL YB-2248]
MSKEDAPIVIPSSHLINTPCEQFDGTKYGICTWHTLISKDRTKSSNHMACGLGVCPPKVGILCAHRHLQAEIYHILEGEGTVTIDKVDYKVDKGATVYIPGDSEHGIKNDSDVDDLKWFYVFPTASFSDVIYRFS